MKAARTYPDPPAIPLGDEAGEYAGALDLMLTDAALGTHRRFLPGASTARFVGALARRPRRVASRVNGLAVEYARIAAGSSSIAPSTRDRRFADPAWTQNPLLRRSVQAYLATTTLVEGLVQDVPLEWQDRERISFLASNLLQAVSPSNNPLISPVAWKAMIDSGGVSAVRGLRNLLGDLARAPRVPTMVPPDAYEVGSDLALTHGSVVLRTPMFELIQYQPQTETVYSTPLVIVPPTINKFYIMDIAPQRSLIEYFVSQGVQVFLMSWRNPDARHSKWGLDTYARAVLKALDTTRTITETDSAHLLGACSGGILSALVAAHLADGGRQDQLASLTLMVTLLDQTRAGTTGALADDNAAKAAIAASRARGYLDGKQLAELFAWLRPSDLVWNYWVNNYLQGRTPPAFDILYWNADTTRMPSKLHRDFLSLAMANALTRPGGATLLGTEIDLGQVQLDSYVVAGSADHICPWRNCYASTQLLGGKSRFILSTNGHIASLVNPPGNKKSSYQVAEDTPASADDWAAAASTTAGSWWPDYIRWLGERSGEMVPAPESPGGRQFQVLGDAPGSYVLDH
ncbi:PHA/PHB synthase family protein [Streptomyces sp. NPDC050743]|uniref:PHA/PHB synthase family protein n=1 Tax=Streptomyces sp. NPDC050743 TaxID=3365634 RepID=UPI0037A6A77F